MKFKSIIECTTDHVPAGRRNGIDCVEVSRRGLLGICEDGLVWRYDYVSKVWVAFP